MSRQLFYRAGAILRILRKCIPFCFLGGENLNNTHVSRDCRTSSQLVPHFITNNHTHLFGISNPKYKCYLNSVIQLLLPILSTIGHNFQFNSSTEDSISKCLFEIAQLDASNSTDVDTLKFRLVQYDTFCNGQIQQDSAECFMMIIEIINKG